MALLTSNQRLRSEAASTQEATRDTDSLAPALRASIAYTDAINSLHALARALEALGEAEHAKSARKDGDHYAELYERAKQVRRDALALKHRADRHLVRMEKGDPANG